MPTLSSKQTVVIDAGHGGHDAGAVDNGAREKEINLLVALQVEKALKEMMPELEVVLTRHDDTFLSLQERAAVANKAKGDLFVSIHTNSVDKTNPNRKNVEGTSVYVLGVQKDEANMKVARRENSVIELESDYTQKYSGFDPNRDESYIIFEMAQKINLNQSYKFANETQKQLVSGSGRKDRGVKQAGFWVLWATYMPSVLVELDFICNPDQAAYLSSEEGAESLGTSIARAVTNYFTHQMSSQPQLPMSSLGENSQDKDMVLPMPKSESRQQSVKSADTERVGSALGAKRRRRGEKARESSASRDLEAKVMPKANQVESTAEQSPEEVKTVMADADMSAIEVPGKKRHEKKSTAPKPKKEKLITVYKIQILVSKDLLKTSDPRFQGLSEVSSFKENGMYKYTCGESTDRKTIDALLKEVKAKIPDAFIITQKKNLSAQQADGKKKKK